MQEASDETAAIIRTNWTRVQEQVGAACDAAARPAEQVTIVGVSKYVSPPIALLLAQAGCCVLGENRPQAIWDKAEYFRQQGQPAEWHMIGHLQRNKIRRIISDICCVHSLDSLRLAQALSEEAVRVEQCLRCLIEVNVTQDASKTGLPAHELEVVLEQTLRLPGISIQGLMAMSTQQSTSDAARREFASVRDLRDKMQSRYPEIQLSELSMGMSSDFREAIAEGATLVRIGSNLWQGII